MGSSPPFAPERPCVRRDGLFPSSASLVLSPEKQITDSEADRCNGSCCSVHLLFPKASDPKTLMVTHSSQIRKNMYKYQKPGFETNSSTSLLCFVISGNLT